MTGENKYKYGQRHRDLIGEVNDLAEKVRMAALNLAVNLARSKGKAKELVAMEPLFTRLINGSVEVIKEVAAVMRDFRSEKTSVYSHPASGDQLDNIEKSMNRILDLSQEVLETIIRIKKNKGKVDNYRWS